MRNIALSVLLLPLAVPSGLALGAQDAQQAERLSARDAAADKFIDEQLPIVDLNAPKPTEPAARAKRLAKDRRHNLGLPKPTIGGLITRLSTVYEWPPDFPPLPIAESTSILVGKVSESTAHISEDKTGVYSEVVLKVEELLRDTTGITETVTAEREGGRVQFPWGPIFRYYVEGAGIPKPNHRYLLFLKQLDDGDFSIVTGYELLNGRVVPLDYSGIFGKYQGYAETQFLSEVRDAIRNQTTPPKD